MYLSHRQRAGYAAGDFGLNLYWQGTNFFLLYYYTGILEIPAVVAGIVVAAGGILDTVTDPVAGVLAEKTKGRWGRYRGYLAMGAVPLGLSFAALFFVPIMTQMGILIAFALCSNVLFRLAYTVVSVPYAALGAALTADADERSVLSGFRMYGGFLGGLCIVALVALCRKQFGDVAGFRVAALIAATLGGFLILVTFMSAKEEDGRVAQADEAVRLRSIPSLLLRNGAFLSLTGGVALFTVGVVFLQATVLHRFELIYQDPAAGDVALVMLTASPLLGIPAWSLLTLKLGKRRAWISASAVLVASLLLLLLGRLLPLPAAYLAYGLIGASISGLAVLQWAMLPDTVEFGQYRSRRRLNAVVIGSASAVQKLSAALAAVLVGAALQFADYAPQLPASGELTMRLNLLTGIPPVIAMLISLLIMRHYPLNEDKHRRIVRALERRLARAIISDR